MGIIKGGALRLIQTLLYALAFLCGAVILGIYSYFLATLADRDSPIQTWVKAVEGISGAAVLYTIFAVVLTCCLGGISFFALLAIVSFPSPSLRVQIPRRRRMKTTTRKPPIPNHALPSRSLTSSSSAA